MAGLDVGPIVTETLTVETELRASTATVQLVNFSMAKPFDGVIRDPANHRLIMSVTRHPPNTRVSYGERRHGDRPDRLGDIYFFPVGRSFRAVGDGGVEQTSLVCELPGRFGYPWCEEADWAGDHLDATLDIVEPRIRWLMRRLAAEARSPRPDSEALVDAVAAHLAIELGRYFATTADRAPGGLAPWRLRIIDGRLAADHDNPPSLNELAKLCGLSSRHLARGFRVSRGCSLGDYATRLRMQKAMDLLSKGEKVYEVAMVLGYATASGFSEAFRKQCGCTPGEFKRAAL